MATVTPKQLEQQLKQALSKQTKDIFIEVSSHIDKTILPQLDKLSKRVVIIEENMATKNDIDKIERRLVKINDAEDRFGGRIDNNERRISKLETKSSLTS